MIKRCCDQTPPTPITQSVAIFFTSCTVCSLQSKLTWLHTLLTSNATRTNTCAIFTYDKIFKLFLLVNPSIFRKDFIVSSRHIQSPHSKKSRTSSPCGDFFSFYVLLPYIIYVMQSGHFSLCPAFLSRTAKERDKKYSVKSPQRYKK